MCGGENVNMRLFCVKGKTGTSVRRVRWGVGFVCRDKGVCMEEETGVVEREPGVYGRRESRMWRERKICGCFWVCYDKVCVCIEARV